MQDGEEEKEEKKSYDVNSCKTNGHKIKMKRSEGKGMR